MLPGACRMQVSRIYTCVTSAARYGMQSTFCWRSTHHIHHCLGYISTNQMSYSKQFGRSDYREALAVCRHSLAWWRRAWQWHLVATLDQRGSECGPSVSGTIPKVGRFTREAQRSKCIISISKVRAIVDARVRSHRTNHVDHFVHLPLHQKRPRCNDTASPSNRPETRQIDGSRLTHLQLLALYQPDDPFRAPVPPSPLASPYASTLPPLWFVTQYTGH